MMLYTKHTSSGPCSFRQEDFWKLHFKNSGTMSFCRLRLVAKAMLYTEFRTLT